MEEEFEAPEKRLAIGFYRDIRTATKPFVWEAIVKAAGATIVNKQSNRYVDAYILSESSLFVWKDQLLLLTCGNGILLNALDEVLACWGAKELSYFTYQRKRPLFPHLNHFDFSAEVDFIKARLPGMAHTVSMDDHHGIYLFNSPFGISKGAAFPGCQVMMYSLSVTSSARFSVNSNSTADEVLEHSGIKKCLPGMRFEPCLFSPQGFSLNATRHESYATLHVSPQSPYSYAGFETSLSPAQYGKQINDLIDIFVPRSFILVLKEEEKQIDNPHGPGQSTVSFPGYKSVYASSRNFNGKGHFFFSKYVLLDR